LLGVELVLDRDSKTPADDLAEAVFYRCLDEGLSFKLTMGNTITLTPPLILTREQMDNALDIIESALATECRLAGIGSAQ
jgi:4-aminobutyrate aminotransferase